MTTIKEQAKKVESEIKKLDEMGGRVGMRLLGMRDNAFNRYPLVFVMLSSFGLVATFYGFEKVIDSVPYFAEHPHMILITGIAVLVFTGSLYKKLT